MTSTGLERELKKLRPDDWKSQRAWAFWAERRGKDLNDAKLKARGVMLEEAALWLEASRPRRRQPGPRRPIRRQAESRRTSATPWLTGGSSTDFAKATSADDLRGPGQAGRGGSPSVEGPESGRGRDQFPDPRGLREGTPAEAYRDAPGDRPGRASTASSWPTRSSGRSRSNSKPGRSMRRKLAEVARERLPDRPALADRLGRQGLAEAEARVASMRQSEVEELAAKFRERGEEDRARRLIQSWLADRRKNRLSASDAEGRILLASTFDKMLGDRATAGELLREAQAIDPQSKAVVDAFLRMGFRKGDAGWYDPTVASASPPASPDVGKAGDRSASRGEPNESLWGLTRAQVRSRLGGKPDVVVRSASQSRSVEQWIYKNGKGVQVVRFVYEPGNSEPRASAYYSDRK